MAPAAPQVDATDAIARTYRRFAREEAAGRSPIYAAIAEHIGRELGALAFLAALPPAKRQPNLLFGAIQYLTGRLTGPDAFETALAQRAGEIAAVMTSRTTQTNIAARCATLLPALARLPQPLALVEVGASAGLCLYPDRYAYDFDGHVVPPRTGDGAPLMRCAPRGATPLPAEPVEVVWRAGLDLNPLDVRNREDVAWLDALVWPGEEHLRDQLHRAVDIARADPPYLVTGDLTEDLPALVSQAPAAGTVVVFHTAVLAYVPDPAARSRFADAVSEPGATWLANEVPTRIPGLPADVVDRQPAGQFLLCEDGTPFARTDPHGSWIDWL
jgi:hypothetical protein